MPPTALADSLALLRTRRFGTFWFACLLSNLGTWAQQVAQPWLLLSLGASAFVVGLDSFALGAPVWLLTLVGGVLADRTDRRRLIATCQSIQMLCPMLLVVLLLTGQVQPWIVVTLSLVVGITDALSMPSFQSIVPSIVAREQIASGLALNSTQFNLSRILGPAIAGMLMVSVGAVGCFALSAASYVPFILVALWILPRAPVAPQAAGRFDSRHPFAGFREIAASPQLRGALVTVFANSLICGPLITFCPVLVKSAFAGDAGHFSMAMAAFGIGGMAGAVGLLAVAPGRDRRPISWLSAIGYGVTLTLIALNTWFWALLGLLTLAGMAMSVSNISANTLLQTAAPVRLRGQSVSLFMLATRGGLAIGSLLTGLSVSQLGVQHALLVNGLLAVLVQAFAGSIWRAQVSSQGLR